MSCPHTLKRDAGFCSQCAGIPVKRISVIDHQLCVDGIATGRDWDAEPRRITARRRAKR